MGLVISLKAAGTRGTTGSLKWQCITNWHLL